MAKGAKGKSRTHGKSGGAKTRIPGGEKSMKKMGRGRK